MIEQYDPARLKREMSNIICEVWTANGLEHPPNADAIQGLDWIDIEFELPVIYMSRRGGEPRWADFPRTARTGAIMREMHEAYGLIEMLVDLGIINAANVRYSAGSIPMVDVTMPFPDIADVGLTQEQYRLMMGSALLGWITVYMIDAYRRDMSRIVDATLDHVIKEHDDDISRPTADPSSPQQTH